MLSEAPLDVVYFAGCGGSSEAYHMALGSHPAVALNHNAVAIGVHQMNFPDTEHMIADVFDVDPRNVRPGQKWRSFWASPDCRHFSKAKGGAPVSPRVRGLAWIVVKVAKLLGENRPDVIFLENVEEFVDWCPLGRDGKPDMARKGETFRLWVKRLEQCGGVVEWRFLTAADYGDPTTRKRLFLICRFDGRPIVWPEATHAPRKTAAARGLKTHRAAAEIIDWSLPCPSIFLTQAECKARGIRAKRPLEEATLRRIAKGIERYVIGAAEPFIVPIANWSSDSVHAVSDPLRTVTAWPKGGSFAVVEPTVVGGTVVGCGSRAGQSPPRGLDEPVGTIIGKADRCLAAATLLRTDNSGAIHAGVHDPETPLRTITSAGGFAMASALLTKFSENSIGEDPREPLHTVMAGAPRHGVVAAFLGRQFGTSTGSDLEDPVGTVMCSGMGKTQLVSAFMEQANTGVVGHGADEPVSTVTGRGTQQRLVQAELAKPFAEHGDELRAFLVKYYGTAEAADLADPLHSVTSRARFGLVIVSGVVWQIVDIGMRMLTPGELRAAQGFPKGYITGWSALHGKVTKTDETKLIGNSVCPGAASKLIAANLGPGRWSPAAFVPEGVAA